jgi:hypothetical protein
VAFKATAGLHHPVRGEYRLTYEADSERTTMHGFLNVFLAACFMYGGAPDSDVNAIVSETSHTAFEFDDKGVDWTNHRLENRDLEAARRNFAISFGSCSFEEPIEDLKGLQLL